MRVPPLAAKLALAVVSLAAALAVGEAVLRYREGLQALDGQPSSPFFNGCIFAPGIMSADAQLGFRNVPGARGYSIRVFGRPNLVVPESFDLARLEREGLRTRAARFRINGLGNRGGEVAAGKPPGTARLVFLGDSITFGFYVGEDETFVALAAERLAQAVPAGCRLEALNAGVSSLNSGQVLAHLRERALDWSPDVVVWSFYANDVRDTGGQEGDLLFPARRGVPGALSNLAAGRLLRRWLAASRLGASLPLEDADPANAAVEAAWKRVEAELLAGRDLLRERGAALLVAAFPAGVQLERPWTAAGYQDRLAALCERLGIPFVDLLPAFAEAGTVAELYHEGDLIHPTERGHSAAAAALAERLLAEAGVTAALARGCASGGYGRHGAEL